MTIPPLAGSKLFGIHLVRAIVERYGFLNAPQSLEDFDLQKGITFHQGYIGGGTISSVSFYNNGIRVESQEGTGVADMFMDDVVGWMTFEAGVGLTPTHDGLRIYTSAMEVELGMAFAEKFSLVSGIGQLIGQRVKGYGGPDTAYETTGLMMWSHLQNQGPAQFRLERRVDTPFPANVYFSSAPLTTDDHLAVLSACEVTLA